MRIQVDPLSGRITLVPKTPKPRGSGGGGGGGGGRTSYVNPVAADPDSGADGDMIYNYTDNVLKVWFNNMWNSLSGTGGGTTGGSFDFSDGSDLAFIDGSFLDYIT